MGKALLRKRPDIPLYVERHDDHRSLANLAWWLRDPRAEVPWDSTALDRAVAEPVLDVGCATGRYVELLRDRGMEAVGIDTCSTAVAVGQAAGQPCWEEDVWRYVPKHGYSTVMALGGNLGIAGSIEALPAFLARLTELLAPGGRLVLGSIDWRVTTRQHEDFLLQQRQQGRYPGDVWLRLRHGASVSSWFPWVWADREALENAASQVGLRLANVATQRHHYVAWLVREDN